MKKPKIILGIETSCDETAASVGQITPNGVKILSNVVASSLELQSKYGGIVPEQAAREQLKSIIPVINETIENCKLKIENLDAIAVTEGPGLIGSLLVGVETAKVLSLVWNKPLIPVNHLLGHFYANWIENQPSFPAIGLLVSGGHTDLVLIKGHGNFKKIGGTRDDAAGECFDKCARLLGLPYPGGPAIANLAEKGNPKAFNFPRPMINSGDFDFSFSGLKTAVANLLKESGKTAKSQATKKCCEVERSTKLMNSFLSGAKQTPSEPIGRASGFLCCDELSDLCASIQDAIIDVLIKKTVAAAQKYNTEHIILAGGVAANSKLREKMQDAAQLNFPTRVRVSLPPPSFCTDNAAMIASAAFYNPTQIRPLGLQANPNAGLTS